MAFLTYKMRTPNLEESRRLGGLEDLAVSLGGSAGEAVGGAELDARVKELLDVLTANLGGGDRSNINNPDGGLASAVAGSKLSVHLVDGTVDSEVTVLLVHVVGTRTGVVADLNSEVLDVVSVLLEELVNLKDLTGGSLGLVKHGKEVPEAGLSNLLVGSKELHAEDLGLGVLGSGLVTADNLIQVINEGSHLQKNSNVVKNRGKSI